MATVNRERSPLAAKGTPVGDAAIIFAPHTFAARNATPIATPAATPKSSPRIATAARLLCRRASRRV
jgi:hypothetical protein